MLAGQHVHKFKELQFHEVAYMEGDKLRIYKASMNDPSPELLHFYEKMVVVSSAQAANICAETAGQNSTQW